MGTMSTVFCTVVGWPKTSNVVCAILAVTREPGKVEAEGKKRRTNGFVGSARSALVVARNT